MFVFVIITYIIVITIESIPLLKQKNNVKTIFYFTLIIFSMIISILLSLGTQLPSPSDGIKDIVQTILGKIN